MLGKSGNNHERLYFRPLQRDLAGTERMLVYLAMVSTWSISSRQRQQEGSKAPSRLRDVLPFPASVEDMLVGQLPILYQKPSVLPLPTQLLHSRDVCNVRPRHPLFSLFSADDVSHITL